VVLDDEAATDRLAYCLDNPVDAHLVETPDSWPGINLAFGMGEEDSIEYEYLDRTAWHKKSRPESSPLSIALLRCICRRFRGSKEKAVQWFSNRYEVGLAEGPKPGGTTAVTYWGLRVSSRQRSNRVPKSRKDEFLSSKINGKDGAMTVIYAPRCAKPKLSVCIASIRRRREAGR